MGHHEYHNVDMEGSEPKAGGQSFYIYHDRDGNTHVVDRKSLIPRGQRDIKHVKLPEAGTQSPAHGAVTPGNFVNMLPPDISSKALEILRQSGEATGSQGAEGGGGVMEMAQAALKSEAAAPGTFRAPETPMLPMVFVAGLVIGASWALKPLRRPLLKFGMSVVGIWALGSLYIHWMGQQTGLRIASNPAAMVRQAQDNAQKMHKAIQGEQQALDSLPGQ